MSVILPQLTKSVYYLRQYGRSRWKAWYNVQLNYALVGWLSRCWGSYTVIGANAVKPVSYITQTTKSLNKDGYIIDVQSKTMIAGFGIVGLASLQAWTLCYRKRGFILYRYFPSSAIISDVDYVVSEEQNLDCRPVQVVSPEVVVIQWMQTVEKWKTLQSG